MLKNTDPDVKTRFVSGYNIPGQIVAIRVGRTEEDTSVLTWYTVSSIRAVHPEIPSV